jgi:glucan phosphoethanolaminetransferase (alkaline phosphatase superfamily)
MELTELQNIWQQYDKKLSENTRLNKEVLKMMLKSKPEKKVNWIKLKAAFNLILPIVIILVMMVPRVEFRNETSFYVGFFLFGPFALLTYYWAIRYYLLINKIDFSNSISTTKKNIKEVEKYKIKMTKFGYLFSPFAMAGVFLIANIPILSKQSFLPISLIISVFIISIYVTFKYSIFERFKKLNMEIEEIEQLEKE